MRNVLIILLLTTYFACTGCSPHLDEAKFSVVPGHILTVTVVCVVAFSVLNEGWIKDIASNIDMKCKEDYERYAKRQTDEKRPWNEWPFMTIPDFEKYLEGLMGKEAASKAVKPLYSECNAKLSDHDIVLQKMWMQKCEIEGAYWIPQRIAEAEGRA